jgi:aryl-alcohol dehydrogenase-like predicted oxidoreductase
MQKRTLGQSGIEVPTLAFGGNIFGWTVDEAKSFKLLDAIVESGLNFIDTADGYSRWVPGNKGGESETIIGRWMKERKARDKVVLATKVGMDMGGDKKGLKKSYIFKAVEDSLTRLQTDRIDLYQSHIDDLETPQEETLSAYAQLIKEGKVRAIGASNFTAARLKEALDLSEAHGLPRYETLQPHYNLYDRVDFETNLEALCLTQAVGVIPYFSLASGFLSGKYRSEDDMKKSARGGGIKKYLNPKGYRILAALDEVAKEQRSTPASVALAWLMARPSITAPIASATSIEQVHALLEGTRIELTRANIETLTRASID